MQSKKTSPKIDSSRGVLHLKNSQTHYQLKQFQPSNNLQLFVEQFWHVTWDLRKKTPHTQKNLPQANMHLTFEGDQALIYGPVKSSFTRTLIEKGNIFGIKFHVGALFPIIQRPISDFTDQVINLASFLNQSKEKTQNYSSLSLKLNSENNVNNKIKIVEHFLQGLLFERTSPFFIDDIDSTSKEIIQVRSIIELISNNHSITKVTQLSGHTGLLERALQRLFKTYIGLSPKWLIRKYRIHELLDRLEANPSKQNLGWQQTVLDLDYVDQAHLINDFKSFIGCSPQQYLHQKLTQP